MSNPKEPAPEWAMERARKCTAHINFDTMVGRYDVEGRIADALEAVAQEYEAKGRREALEDAAAIADDINSSCGWAGVTHTYRYDFCVPDKIRALIPKVKP